MRMFSFKTFSMPTGRGLADFDAAAASRCGGVCALNKLLSDSVELRSLRALWAGQCDRESAVSAFTNGGDKVDRTEERSVELGRGALGAALGEDVDLLVAVRAGKVAHVLDDA